MSKEKEIKITNTKLFSVVDETLVISADALTIPAILFVWNGDESKNKLTAIKSIAVAYWATHNECPYIEDTLIRRVAKLMSDYRLPATEKSKENVKKLVEYFEQSKSVKQKLYNSATKGVSKVSNYIDNIELGVSKDVETLNAVKSIVSVLGDVVEMIDMLDNAKQRVEKENEEVVKSKVVGGGNVNLREK